MQDEPKGLNDEFLGQKIGEGLDPTGERMLLTSSLQSVWHGHLAPCCISRDVPAGMETPSLALQELWCSPPPTCFVRSFISSAPALSGAPGVDTEGWAELWPSWCPAGADGRVLEGGCPLCLARLGRVQGDTMLKAARPCPCWSKPPSLERSPLACIYCSRVHPTCLRFADSWCKTIAMGTLGPGGVTRRPCAHPPGC